MKWDINKQQDQKVKVVKGIEKKSLFLKFAGFRELGIIGFLVILVIIVSIRNPVFLSFGNLYDIGLDIAILAIISVGQMMVILTGGIDISVGSGIGLSAMVSALILMNYWEIPPSVALLMGIAIGSLIGSVNGLLIVKGKIPPIIATLGTMSIFRGLTFIINYKVNLGKWVGADKLSIPFKDFARGTFLKIPNLILITIIVYIIFYYFLNHTVTGRQIYAVGSNLNSAKAVGINTDKVIFLTYLFTGMLVGMAGVLWVSRYTSAQTDSGVGFEFVTITAVILGGVSIFGGSGSIIGVLFGSILIGTINNSLNIIRVSPFWKLAINGFIILMAVIVDNIISNRRNEVLLKRRKI
jgi:rhamnose transport system permease protein